MFGTYFYHERIRKSVALFGAMFNNIYVLRKDSSGGVINTMKVPLAYGPKQKFLAALDRDTGRDAGCWKSNRFLGWRYITGRDTGNT